ncbi:MAG: sulfotransferase, partial [Aestuariivirga sp.]|nr:sulfotransferase [Aestuariivirga sp.]
MSSNIFMEAAERCRRLEAKLRLDPSDARSRVEIADDLILLGRPDLALAQVRAGLSRPRPPLELYKAEIESCLALGQLQPAEKALEKARRAGLPDETYVMELTRLRELDGRPAEAARLFRRLVKTASLPPAVRMEALGRLALLDVDLLPAEKAQLIAAVRGARPDHPHYPLLLHAAARRSEADGAIAIAFSCYQRAGHAAAQRARPDGFGMAEVEAARTRFTRQSMEAGQGGSPSRRPIFVFGMQRSGTTLVEQILSSHPLVGGAGELKYFRAQAGLLNGAEPSAVQVSTLAGDYLQLIEACCPGADRVVDKMPDNYQHLWLIARCFPEATFIHCRRDPLDTCVSCFRNPIRKRYMGSLTWIADYYKSYARLMAHWKTVLPIPILDVDYEALVSDPDTQIRRILDFAGLPFAAKCLTPHLNRRPVLTPSRDQVSKPITTASIGSWKRYESFLAPLIKALDRTGHE